MPLTGPTVKQAKPKAKPYQIWDSHGLHLVVQPSGVKGWRWKYRWRGKEKRLSLGPYPLVSLKRARDDRDVERLKLRDGIDPQIARRQRRGQSDPAAVTVREVALDWLTTRHAHAAPRTIVKLKWFLHRRLIPALGARAIVDVTPQELLAVLRTIEKTGRHETAHRLREICGQLWRYAVGSGLAKHDIASDLRGLLTPVPSKHHAAITDPVHVGGLLRALESLPPHSAVGAAMRIAPYVFVRPGELRQMAWAELDLKARVWKLPAHKMKLRRDHLVPLAGPVIALLKARRPFTGTSAYVFPSPRGRDRALSETAFGAALKQLGYESSVMTPHGWRAMARTLLDEQLRVSPDVIELQLAHTVPGALGSTYNRAAHIEARVKMMRQWAAYLDRLRAETPERK